ncbi:histidine kinase [Nigerium massiliense]|uniref:histidine kinase n=1 Tax=Nigerium massiliense TaxID=1522317 RepID=UPI0006935BEC|nr:histidine kinase [Nigerium massiliense]
MLSRQLVPSTVATGLAALLVLGLLVSGLSASSSSIAPWLTVTILLTTLAALLLSHRERLKYRRLLRAQAVENALIRERLAIARDLHDIVSHGLALITMRASVARYATPPRAGRASGGPSRRRGRQPCHHP